MFWKKRQVCLIGIHSKAHWPWRHVAGRLEGDLVEVGVWSADGLGEDEMSSAEDGERQELDGAGRADADADVGANL